MSEHTTTDFQPLVKHTYPLHIKIVGGMAVSLFLALVPRFLLVDLPHHREAHRLTRRADKLFDHKDYNSALSVYDEIAAKYPAFNKVKNRHTMNRVKALFALSSQNTRFFARGMSHLLDHHYYDSEIEAMQRFLPYEYREFFASQFTFEKA